MLRARPATDDGTRGKMNRLDPAAKAVPAVLLPPASKRPSPYYWAAFVLSGDGR